MGWVLTRALGDPHTPRTVRELGPSGHWKYVGVFSLVTICQMGRTSFFLTRKKTVAETKGVKRNKL